MKLALTEALPGVVDNQNGFPKKHPGVCATDSIGIEYIDQLLSYALALTHNRTEAEDLVQEAYLRAAQAASRLRENSNTRAWLFVILRNVWRNELRRRRSAPTSYGICRDADDVVASTAQDSYDLAAFSEQAEVLWTAIRSLPATFKETILLREFEGLPYKEIAEALGCPVGTVMSRLGRARAKLRSLLTERLSLLDEQMNSYSRSGRNSSFIKEAGGRMDKDTAGDDTGYPGMYGWLCREDV